MILIAYKTSDLQTDRLFRCAHCPLGVVFASNCILTHQVLHKIMPPVGDIFKHISQINLLECVLVFFLNIIICQCWARWWRRARYNQLHQPMLVQSVCIYVFLSLIHLNMSNDSDTIWIKMYVYLDERINLARKQPSRRTYFIPLAPWHVVRWCPDRVDETLCNRN